jgi:hypothetical protein
MNVKFKETDIDSKIRIYSMNMDPSNNNSLTNGGGGNRNGDNFYERFHMNQYYNAVEDEQTYMDEYTSLIHTYNDFIVNGNTMFSRMEQTLRDNLSRSLVRQTFYYHRFDDLRRARGIPVAPSTSQFISTSGQSHAPAAPIASAAATPPIASAASAATTRIADVFPRLLSRYVNTDISRELRQPIINQPDNIISMLYTVPLDIRANGGGGGGAAARASAPTNEQIIRATQDTLFSHIISPVNATCPISRDEFNDESEITMLRGCNHIFNRASLREWFVHHSTCPLCRSDIRDYRPLSEPTVPVPRRHMSIDSVDENHITFSYDLPLNYTNNQIYHDIVNTVNDMTSATPPARNQYHYDDDDDDEIPEVD